MIALALAFLLAAQPNQPGTLLTLRCDKVTWEGCGRPAVAELHLVVVEPSAREVCVMSYDPRADGWPVVIPVPPVQADPWTRGGVVRGIQLRGGDILTYDGRVVTLCGH